MRILLSSARASVKAKLLRMEWCEASVVPDRLNLIRYLITHNKPFFVVLTDTWTASTGQPVEKTTEAITLAATKGYISSPIRLAYRKEPSSQDFFTDLGLLITLGELDNFSPETLAWIAAVLEKLDSPRAAIAAVKRTGCLSSAGVYQNSFRTAKLDTLLLRQYLSFLTGRDYLALEFSCEYAGSMSRWAWDFTAMAPARIYGREREGESTYSATFQLSDFECL